MQYSAGTLQEYWFSFFGTLYYYFHRNEKQRIADAVWEGLGPDRKEGNIRNVIRNVFKGHL